MGTLAGHPVADLMFALADAEVDDYYHEQLRNDDLLVHVPTAGVEERWGCDGNVAEKMPLVLQVRRPAYCDDAITPIIAPALQLVSKLLQRLFMHRRPMPGLECGLTSSLEKRRPP